MRHAIAAVFLLLGLLGAAPSTVVAQTIPGTNTPFGGLARQIAGIEVIKAEITSLRRELSGCDAPGASKTGVCATRALRQAKLNYLLEVSMALGDPDTAGAPPKPTAKPTDATDYETEQQYLQQQLRQERGVYVISENRAKYWIILHCKAMKDTRALATYKTQEEKASMDDDRTGKTKADISACIKEYDPKAIAANRKTAFEYCLPATTEKDGARPLLNLCMHKHDMLTAMCRQEIDFLTAWRYHKDPQAQHAWGRCPQDRLFVSPSEVQAIMAAPPVRAMDPVSPKFFAPPDVSIAPRPSLQIPAGTVIELTIQGSWDGAGVERVEATGSVVPAMLDQPLMVGGKEILGAHSAAFLKGRIVGAGARFDPIQNRPDTLQIAFTTDEINIDALDCRVCGKWADLKSNEVVFTVPYQSNANRLGVMFNTRLRFTVGASGSVDGSPAPTPAGGRRGAAPPTPTAPPQTPAAPAPTASDPQQRGDEARKRTERVQACVQQAMRENPTGGIALSTAIAACAQTK